MADYRKVFTKIWEDDWFTSLSAEGKTLYLYLLTNYRASVAGIYRLPYRVIPFETGLGTDTIRTLIEQFEQDGKINYDGAVMWVHKLREYQASKSPKVQTRILSDVNDLPDSDLKRAYQTAYGYGIDTVSIPGHIGTPEEEEEEEEPLLHEEEHGKKQKRTPLQLLDSLMPGQITTTTRQWLDAIVEDHGEEEVRSALIAALAAERVTYPKGLVLKILKDRREEALRLAQAGVDDPDPYKVPPDEQACMMTDPKYGGRRVKMPIWRLKEVHPDHYQTLLKEGAISAIP